MNTQRSSMSESAGGIIAFVVATQCFLDKRKEPFLQQSWTHFLFLVRDVQYVDDTWGRLFSSRSEWMNNQNEWKTGCFAARGFD